MQRTEMRLVGLLAGALAACAGPDSTEIPQPDPDELPTGDVLEPVPAGGQSGTDRPGEETEGPPCPAAEPLDRSGEWEGITVAELLASVTGAQSMSGEWVLSDVDTNLEISVTDLGGGFRVVSQRTECSSIRVPIEVSLQIGQSFAVGPVTTELIITSFGGASTGLEFDATAFADPEQLPEQLYEVDGSAELVLRPNGDDFYSRRSATIIWGARHIGEFETGRRLPHLPLAAVAEDCDRVEPTDVISLAGENDALQAINGQWALCEAEHRLPVAGIEIRADRSWSTIRADEGLELGMGFDEEGSSSLVDISAMNGAVGWFQVNLPGPNWQIPAGRVSRSASGNTIRMGDTVAVRLTRPVRAAEPPQFAVGERAGSAGCASNETQFEAWPLDEAGVDASLRGSWAICSGGSGTLRFQASGQLEFLDSEGVPIRSEPYAGHPDMTTSFFESGYVGGLSLGAGGDVNEYWYLVRSSQPVKIQAVRYAYSADQERRLETLVLSALPE